METLSAAPFGLPVGFSDHTLGFRRWRCGQPLRGAVDDREAFHSRPLAPGTRSQGVARARRALRHGPRPIREVERALGEGIKHPTESEARNRAVARKHLVATRKITAGEKFSRDERRRQARRRRPLAHGVLERARTGGRQGLRAR